MPPDTADLSWLLDMLRYATEIRVAVAGLSFDQYAANADLRLAIERRIEIVGEAARHVSPAFQTAHPEIPWRQIIAQRHVLAHGYARIDNAIIWRVATIHIPVLIGQLEAILTPPPGS